MAFKEKKEGLSISELLRLETEYLRVELETLQRTYIEEINEKI